MQLIFTDHSFVVAGVPSPGVPFLIDDRGALADAANRYLFHTSCLSGRSRAQSTRRTYADHLYDFFSFLESNDLSWENVKKSYIAAWRNGMLDRGLARSTCNNRMRTVSAFYDWCHRAGIINEIPFEYVDIRVRKHQEILMHIDASGSRIDANEMMLRAPKHLPKFLTLREACQFIESLSPYRTRLLGWLMLLTGLRREEAAHIDIRILPNLGGYDPSKSIKVLLDPALTPTKGSKERWVLFPYQLAGHIHDYMMRERPKLMRRHKQQYGTPTTRLFLTQTGDELSLDGVSEQFRQASLRSGIRCHPHMLRHTFAVHELIRMSGRPQINALKWLSDRLGHTSVSTTEIYVKAADIVTHDDADGYVADLLMQLAKDHSDE